MSDALLSAVTWPRDIRELGGTPLALKGHVYVLRVRYNRSVKRGTEASLSHLASHFALEALTRM